MPINSKELLQLARELAESPTEVKRRAAISRAYYAAYHRCFDWEQKLPLAGEDQGLRGSHEALIARLRHPHERCDETAAECSRHIGERLDIQREHRVLADYKVKRMLPSRMLSEQLRLAAEVIERCDRHDRGEGFVVASNRTES
ncbi:hypothetical protein [Mitsuaria sp. 7]|uniref:hypothetical protein n=1 Tax=Mitsuaria sp. 7 TaxID=1658665 RepID=UPI0007DDB354|nr:hypothetical protein [Mitsuaria sp. 7]ANH69909.1 hypothetical protein ABE85_24150 [Mitsuaria sp. 7]